MTSARDRVFGAISGRDGVHLVCFAAASLSRAEHCVCVCVCCAVYPLLLTDHYM